MRSMYIFSLLRVLAAASVAYNCISYAFPLNSSWLPGENITNTETSLIFGNTSGPIPWQRDESNLFTIHYCFIRDYDRENIGGIVQAAIKEWWIEVGQAGAHSGDGLVMKEVLDEDGNPVYCMDSTQEDKWNKKTPYDTVPIEYTGGQEGSCSSTIGLRRTSPRTHWNRRLSIDAPHLVQDIMHELGHVFDEL
ncbi:hypothetical protein SVAN01_00584 [Stagonosporopsis vannaccii]|nr:hypothetical protein SVAN01_00584 [Stagonosporopsis vannaccii]